MTNEFKVETILQSLLENQMFTKFAMNYQMNKQSYTLPQLLNELMGAEELQSMTQAQLS